MAENLNSILNPTEREEEQHEETVVETQEETATEETGVEAQVAAETKQEEDPVAALKAQVAAELEAARAEKTALAKERERIRQKEQALEQRQPKQEEQKAPDFWEDPEARLTLERQTFQQELQRQRLEFSEMLAREKHSDFNEKLEVFGTLVSENPALYHQMLKEANPAGWAYEQAAKHMRLKQLDEIGDPQEYENKLREKIRAELEAERAAESERQKAAEVEEKIKQKLPKSGFSELRSVGGGGGKNTYNGPTPLGAIIGNNK